jgi:hypothetical protein
MLKTPNLPNQQGRLLRETRPMIAWSPWLGRAISTVGLVIGLERRDKPGLWIPITEAERCERHILTDRLDEPPVCQLLTQERACPPKIRSSPPALHGDALLTAQRLELQQLIDHLRKAAEGRDDIRTECARVIAGGSFAGAARWGHKLIAAELLSSPLPLPSTA